MRLWQLAAPILLGIAQYVAAEGIAPARNEIPSCRQAFFKEHGAAPTRELIVAIDRTVSLNQQLTSDTIERITRAVRPGDHLALVSFSGLTQDEFTSIEFEGTIDLPATDSELQSGIPAKQVGPATLCFKNQLHFARNNLRSKLAALLDAPLSDARRSEILRALSSISNQMIKASSAPKKTVVVISDMLENSDLTSFYQNRRLRKIEVEKTLARAKAAQLLGGFGGARVFVIGTAAPSSADKSGPGINERLLLQEFWEQWFEASNALVVGLDNPALLREIE